MNIWYIYLFNLVFWVSWDQYPEVGLLGPFLSLVVAFVLKSILSGRSIASVTFCLFVCFHCHKIAFSMFVFAVGACLLIWSESLYVFTEACDLFIFRVIVDTYIFTDVYFSHADFFFLKKTLYNISCNASIVVISSFSILSWKLFISSLIPNGNFAG